METITNLIIENQEVCITVVGFLLAHFASSITVALTKTRDNKFYKLFEAIALVVNKAKDK